MKINNYLNRYLQDKTYTITIKENSIYITNYLEVSDFSSTKIIIKHKGGKTTIIGTDLVVSKMLNDELLIIGKIKTIEV